MIDYGVQQTHNTHSVDYMVLFYVDNLYLYALKGTCTTLHKHKGSHTQIYNVQHIVPICNHNNVE